MLKNWWKFVCVGLLCYTFLAGLLIPLGAGLKGIQPSYIQTAGAQQIFVNTYGVNYGADIQAGKTQARLRLNATQALCAESVSVGNNPFELVLAFNLPETPLPIDTSLTKKNKKSPYPLLEVYSPSHGYTSMQSAVMFAPKLALSPEPALKPASLCEAVPYPNNTVWQFPFLNILEETIRNLYFHVPMWFGMMFLLGVSVVYSIKSLSKPTFAEKGLNSNQKNDVYATAFAAVGLLYGILGIVTGALWAKNTWGAYWSWDVKQNTSAVALLIYMAYFVLRGSFDDYDKRARISAIYNIFAFSTLIPLLYIVPRMVDSLHPGMGGNPAFSSYDLDNKMRMVFYPSILAFIFLGVWIASLRARLGVLEETRRMED
jgi:heme exporter protein C